MSDEQAQTELNVKRILSAARELSPEPSPYLRTRVLATLRERAQQQSLWKWKAIAFLSPALSLVLAAAFFWVGTQRSTSELYSARVNERVLVRVEIERLQTEGVRFAEVELPAGVSFYSERYPDLKDKRTLTVALSPDMDISHLPVVIQSGSEGSKKIKIRFLNEGQATVREREITIRFKGVSA
jgi:hypothetical protein